MLILYDAQAGSSSAIRIYPIERVRIAEWTILRKNALRLMQKRFCPSGSIQHLSKAPYELWKATNEFGDQFEMLYFKTGIEHFGDIEHENEIEPFLVQNAYPDIAGAMEAQGRPIRIIAVDLDLTESVSSVPAPKLEITSEIVEAALSDAETLIGTSGAPNALDRVHTAFQAYLEAVCEQDSIAYKDQSNITALFGLIRQHHPRFQIADSDEAKMVWDILRGMARVVDGLNPARNEMSLAHPNALLDAPEAMLVINAIRTMLHYLDNRLK